VLTLFQCQRVFQKERVFVFPNSIAATAKEDAEPTDPANSSQSDDPHRLATNGQGLSPRESQVLACLAEGSSNKVIARLYNLSKATVKVHLKAILRSTIARRQRFGRCNMAFGIIFQNTAAASPTHPMVAGGTQHSIVSKRLGSPYRSGRSPCWIKVKNPKAPAVKREAEEDWGGRDVKPLDLFGKSPLRT
jgi:DNA-binding CsgD family transcriptional regulator